MLSIKLEPCPVCEGEARIVDYGDDFYFPACCNCDALIDKRFYTEDEAAAAWNHKCKINNPKYWDMYMNRIEATQDIDELLSISTEISEQSTHDLDVAYIANDVMNQIGVKLTTLCKKNA